MKGRKFNDSIMKFRHRKRKLSICLVLISILIGCSVTENTESVKNQYSCSNNNEGIIQKVKITYIDGEMRRYEIFIEQRYDEFSTSKEMVIQEIKEAIRRNKVQKGLTTEFDEGEDSFSLAISYDFNQSTDYESFDTQYFSVIVVVDDLANEKEFIGALKTGGFDCKKKML